MLQRFDGGRIDVRRFIRRIGLPAAATVPILITALGTPAPAATSPTAPAYPRHSGNSQTGPSPLRCKPSKAQGRRVCGQLRRKASLKLSINDTAFRTKALGDAAAGRITFKTK